MKLVKWLTTLLVIAIMTAGCGSGVREGDGTPSELTGTVASGAPIMADILIRDKEGNQLTGRTDENGTFAIALTGLRSPLMIRAIAEDGRVMYSYAGLRQKVANVTPLTSYMLDQIAVDLGLAGGVSQLFGFFVNHTDLRMDVADQMDALDALFADAMEAAGAAGFNHFSAVFAANGEGYDAFLDGLDTEMDGDDVVIRVGDGSILNTLPYDINETNLTLGGQVRDAVTDMGIAGASLRFTNHFGTTVSATADSNGSYSVALENYRRYDINITASGYYPVHYRNISTFALGDISAGMIPMISSAITGEGNITGRVQNARTADSLASVSIRLRAGINNRDGEVLATGTTDAGGNYLLTVETGIYTAEFALEGFTKVYATVVAIAGQTTTSDASLVADASGINSAGAFATVVLTWGENPADLDSHLTGPSTALNGRFHLAYYQKMVDVNGNYSAYPSDFNASNPCASEEVVASLDLDDVTSYGPETTTICQVEEGVYSFYVHHFSGISNMSDSPAQVVVTTASGVSRTFMAPPGAPGTTEDVWHVFNLDSNGNVTPINDLINGRANIMFSPAGAFDAEDGSYDRGLIDYLPSK